MRCPVHLQWTLHMKPEKESSGLVWEITKRHQKDSVSVCHRGNTFIASRLSLILSEIFLYSFSDSSINCWHDWVWIYGIRKWKTETIISWENPANIVVYADYSFQKLINNRVNHSGICFYLSIQPGALNK